MAKNSKMKGTSVVDGFVVRNPKSKQGERAIDELLATRMGSLSKKAGCVIVAFGNRAAQRCTGRTLKSNTTAAQKAARRKFGAAAKACKGSKGVRGVAKCVAKKL